jgi:3-mercaptopyruvate sulfurtransferase SseA
VLTLRKLGVADARALVGGFEQWKAAGHPTQTSKN